MTENTRRAVEPAPRHAPLVGELILFTCMNAAAIAYAFPLASGLMRVLLVVFGVLGEAGMVLSVLLRVARNAGDADHAQSATVAQARL